MLQSALLSTALFTLAGAAGPKVGVAPAAMSGDSTSHEAKFQDQLQQSLEEAGVQVVRLEAGWAGDCEGGECMGPAMQSAGVDYVVRAEVEIIERDYLTTLKVYDDTGAATVEEDATCEICTPDEAAAAAAEKAVAATSDLSAPASEPEPAPEGPEPEPAPAAVQSKDQLDAADRTRYIGIGMTAGGAIMLASGIAMIAVEEKAYGPKCGDDNTDASGECEFRNKTVEGGTVLTVLGGLTAGAGATLWYLHRKNKNGSQVAVGPFGRGIKIGGSF